MRCTCTVFRARVHCCVVCSIVSLSNPVRRYERCRSALSFMRFVHKNPSTLSVMETCRVVLTYESVNVMLWCDHSNETSLAVLLHCTICFLIFCRMKFGIFLKFLFLALLEEPDLIPSIFSSLTGFTGSPETEATNEPTDTRPTENDHSTLEVSKNESSFSYRKMKPENGSSNVALILVPVLCLLLIGVCLLTFFLYRRR